MSILKIHPFFIILQAIVIYNHKNIIKKQPQ